jgi:hypothetical protein
MSAIRKHGAPCWHTAAKREAARELSKLAGESRAFERALVSGNSLGNARHGHLQEMSTETMILWIAASIDEGRGCISLASVFGKPGRDPWPNFLNLKRVSSNEGEES